MNPRPYGRCPVCGAAGVSRERRPNGNDQCETGHTYPSRDAVNKPPRKVSATTPVPSAQRLASLAAEHERIAKQARVRGQHDYARGNEDVATALRALGKVRDLVEILKF